LSRDGPAPAPGGPPAGLCELCRHAAVLVSDRGSRFLRCQLSFSDPAYPRFPALPVRRCAGFSPLSPECDKLEE